MNINAISQASGADVLSLYGQNAGGGPAVGATASAAVLKTAVAVAQISEAQLVAQLDPLSSTGTQLNVYA